jgi:hypothetical protein
MPSDRLSASYPVSGFVCESLNLVCGVPGTAVLAPHLPAPNAHGSEVSGRQNEDDQASSAEDFGNQPADVLSDRGSRGEAGRLDTDQLHHARKLRIDLDDEIGHPLSLRVH